MTESTLTLTGSLARAARALVKTSSTDVASAAGLAAKDLREFEKGRAVLTAAQLAALQTALEGFGAVFLPDGPEGRGHGVQLRFSRVGARRVETWEGEGGLAAEDDV